MKIVPYHDEYRGAVERLNARLEAAGSEWQFPTDAEPRGTDQLPVWLESFVAIEGEDVFGGYILEHQVFFLEGRPLEVGDLQLPLSLGQIDSTLSNVSAALLFDIRSRSPLVYSLGLGSEETQFAKLLQAAGWKHMTVPFYFSVKSPNRFARSIRLPGRPIFQSAVRALGNLRLARLAFDLRRLLTRTPKSRPTPPAESEASPIPRFDGFADELFARHADVYSFVGDRRASALNSVYPTEEGRYIRLVVRKGEDVVGWAVVLDTQMRDDKYFGDMRVGTVADSFAAPEDAATVVQAADDFLTRRGVDIVVSNQLHPSWCDALRSVGYDEGPSNFFFYFSEELASELMAVPRWDQRLHVNRGDGEGPAHL